MTINIFHVLYKYLCDR